jgi:hypothetical protein
MFFFKDFESSCCTVRHFEADAGGPVPESREGFEEERIGKGLSTHSGLGGTADREPILAVRRFAAQHV